MDNKEPEIKDNINKIENQPKTRGRPKKYDFDITNRKEYDQKRYEVNRYQLKDKYNQSKEIIKQNYVKNKDELKEKSKELQTKYRDGYKMLISLFNDNEINTSDEKLEKIKKILE
jgi:hypothetical protein